MMIQADYSKHDHKIGGGAIVLIAAAAPASSQDGVQIATLTFLGHVTSSVTWSFILQYVVSYRCSIYTNPLSRAVCDIFSLKHILQGHV